MSKRLGLVHPLRCGFFDAYGMPLISLTVDVKIQRISDNWVWDGSNWVETDTWINAPHSGYGIYRYDLNTGHANFGSPTAVNLIWRDGTGRRVVGSMDFAFGEDYYLRSIVQPKLPTNYIMGSSTPSNMDDDITAISPLIKTDDGSVVADGGNTASTFKTDLTNAINDSYANLQVKFTTGTLAGQTRRISAYNGATKFITVSEAFTTTPSASDQFVVIGRYTSAGSTLTEGGIASAVADVDLGVHSISGSLSQTVKDTKAKADAIEVDTQDIQNRLPSSLQTGRMRSHIEAKDSTLPLSIQEKTDVNAEVDSALNTAIPGSPTADSINERVKTLDDNYTPARATKIDNLDQTLTGMEADIRGVDNDTLKTLSDQVDSVKADTSSMNSRLPSDPADQSQVEAKIDAQTVILRGASSIDHTQLMNGITAIQNNTRFTASVPEWMQKPVAGSSPYRISGNLYDSVGAMEDPDNNEILVRVIQVGGTFITAKLFQNSALTIPLGVATDQVNFPTASGWRKLVRLGVGRYEFFYGVASTDPDEALTIEFGWAESGSVVAQVRSTNVAEVSSDLNDIQVKVNDIHGKLPNTNIMGSTDKSSYNNEILTIYGKMPDNFVMGSSVKSPKDDEIDAILEDTGTTLPQQINDLETDMRGFPRIELAIPDYMTVPALRTKISQEGGIGLTDTTIKVLNPAGFRANGIVQIENEIIIYTAINPTTFQLTGCTRGAFGSTPATHNDQVNVLEVVAYIMKASIFLNDGTMVDADSNVDFAIYNWNNVIKSTGQMSNLYTGVYETLLLLKDGDVPENIKVYVDATKNGVGIRKSASVVVLPTPSTLEYAQETGGGGTGEFSVDHNGWYDNDGTIHPWTDALAGPVKDATSGAPLDDCYITAFPVIDGEVIYSGRPTAQARSLPGGTWLMYLDAGTFEFVFIKEGYRIDQGGRVRRTVG